MNWDRSTFDADGLTGERLNLRHANGFLVGTVIVWPGRVTRVFWQGGRITDYPGRNGRSEAVQAVETVAQEQREADDRRPLLAKINDR
jgi:hypothetical protein